jgi:hypothetical protein
MWSQILIFLLISGSGITSWTSSQASNKLAALIPSKPSNFSAQVSSNKSFNTFITTKTTEDDSATDLLLPDLQTLPPTNLQLFQDTDSGRTYLRFGNSIWNSGPGVLELIGYPDQDKDQIQVIQNIYGSDQENIEQYGVGEFIFHDQHEHWHLDQFAIYEIWSVDEMGTPQTMVATGGKVSYCVMDVSLADNDLSEGIVLQHKSYPHCEENRQGLSVGWVDTYKYFYPGQSIEVSSLEDGSYALVSTADPLHLIKEGNIHNNSADVYFEIRKQQLKIVDYLFVEEEGQTNPR